MLRIGSNINEVRVDGSPDAMRRDLEAFLGFGLTAAEISVHGIDAIKNGKLDEKVTNAAQAILKDFPFAYSVHAPNPVNLMDMDDSALHLDTLLSSLEFARRIKAEAVVYHPGRFQAEETFPIFGRREISDNEKNNLLGKEAEMLRLAAEEFPDVIISMENARPYKFHSPYCYAEIPTQLKRQVEDIARPNVRITLDIGHLHMSACHYGFDPVAETAAIAPLIAHCHLHDNFGGTVYYTEKQQTHQLPLGKGDSHMPVGRGNIDFEAILGTFLRDYQGLLITELRPRYFEKTEESRCAIEMLVAKLGRKTFPVLRR